MFFTVGKQPDPRLPLHTRINGWVVSHDPGWTLSAQTLSKGLEVNWTKIIVAGDVTLEHDTPRSYPLWWDPENSSLTNLLGTGRPIWADKKVRLSDQGLSEHFHNILFGMSDRKISIEQCADDIIDLLLAASQELGKILIPKKLFVSGGVDTVLLYALVKHLQKDDVEILNHEHFEYDVFTNHCHQKIKSYHWAYNQIHHWRTPTVLLTGACGDEYFMRGPVTLSIWAAWHDINLPEILKKSSGYHVGYFMSPKNLGGFMEQWENRESLRAAYPTQADLQRQILDMNANDHQHWHLGETLTWTPFKNLDISKKALELDQKDMLSQIIDAKLNKIIIEKLFPDALRLLSSTKNSNSRENLDSLL